MTKESRCTFEVAKWDESPYREIHGDAKLSRAKVTQNYSGAIEGVSEIEYLMAYSTNGSAAFVGLEHVSGSVGGKSGSFVIRHVGAFENGQAASTWSVVADSGTGELARLRGFGQYVARHTGPAEVRFTYGFEPVT